MRTQFELADVIRKFGKQLIAQEKLSSIQIKALYDIRICRTATLGGHEDACDCCGIIRNSYNSCGNRHCPKCQASKQLMWVEKIVKKTLPIKHYHVIFTVPHCMNKICLWDDKMYYKILFSAVWRTLHSFGYSHYGVESGAVAILHTWGQNLTLHPHIHCMVPSAGYSISGKWKNIGKNGKYLYPVHELSNTFKGKFLYSIKRELRKKKMLTDFDAHIQKAYATDWVVNIQPPMANVDHVVRYLGQYTHKVAITNKRILNISDTHVSFIAKDYTDNAKKKKKTLTGIEFLRRFCQHVLPKRFMKIRYFGIYNSTTKRNFQLQFVPKTIGIIEKKLNPVKETAHEIVKRITGYDVNQCPVCKKGTMHKIRELPRIRSPNNYLPSLLLAKLL